jgi:predicted amidohydrolase
MMVASETEVCEHEMGSTVKVGVGQIGCELGDVAKNLRHCIEVLNHAAEQEISLLVMPECSLSGYVFDDLESARSAAVSLSGSEIGELAEHCMRLGVYCVIGFLEDADGTVYNTAVLLGPEGPIGSYRKCHLPYLGVDRFVAHTNAIQPPVFDTAIGRIGLAICYDIRFPEWARVLALAGAEIIAQPSNWPLESRLLAEHFTIVRACENRVFLLVANRWDTEQDAHFMGQSQIVSPAGEVLAQAGTHETLLSADIDVNVARNKHVVIKPEAFELFLFDDRRPDLYGPLMAQSRAGASPAQG